VPVEEEEEEEQQQHYSERPVSYSVASSSSSFSSYLGGSSSSSHEPSPISSGRNSPPSPSLLPSVKQKTYSPKTVRMREELASSKALIQMHERLLSQREELEEKAAAMSEVLNSRLHDSYQQHTATLSNAHQQQNEFQHTQSLASSFGRFENATPAHAAMFSVLAAGNQPRSHQHFSSNTRESATGSLGPIENGEPPH